MNRVVRLAVTCGLLVSSMFVPQLKSQPQVSNTWYSVGRMTEPRSGAAAVQLSDGRILITGGTDANGVPKATTEMFDPASGAFTASQPMNVPRANHAAIVLKTGDVLVTGGSTTGGSYSESAEIFSITTQRWTLLQASIGTGRAGHAMALLPDGNVMIAGGTSTIKLVDSVVLFNLQDQSFTPIATLLVPRTGAVAAATPKGRVLIAGGVDINGAVLASTEIFDYNQASLSGTITAGPTMTSPRAGATATTTYDGVAVIGGNNGKIDLGTAEIFSQWTSTFKLVSGGTPRSQHFSVLLPNNGGVLAMGGTAGATVDLLQPWANAKAGAFFSPPNSLFNPDRGFASPASLGLLLTAGGMGDYANLAEFYWFPTIATDKPDYAPGTPVEMTGTGFQPFESVTLHIHEWVKQSTDDDPDVTVTADSFGNFVYNGYAPDQEDLGARYHLTAVGMSSGYQAQTIFTDSTTVLIFTNPNLNQQVGACGQLTLQSTSDGTYNTIFLDDSSNNGAFYATQANCQAQTNPITSIAGALNVSLWYRDNVAGNPQLYACTTQEDGGCRIGPATTAEQTEFITTTATQLAFAVQPGGGLPGVPWAVQPVVVVQDSNRNTVSSSTALITLSISTNPAAGTLTCTTNPKNASSGTAAFSGCSINNKAGTCYRLTATSPGLTSATSGCFYIANAAATATVVANPTSVPDNGTSSSTITVTLKDSSGSPVAGKAVSLTPSGGTSTISAASGVSDANGNVTFTVRDTHPEKITYTATDTTDPGPVTGTAQVTFTLGSVSASRSSANGTDQVLANGIDVSTIVVTLLDSTDNPVPGKTVTLTQTFGSSIVSPASAVTNASGVATFTATDIHAETAEWTARDVTDNITVQDTANSIYIPIPTTLTLNSVVPNVVSRGSTSLVLLTVTLKISSGVTGAGTPVAGASISFSVDSSNVTCQAGSSTTTNASGVATCYYNPSSLSVNNHSVRASSNQFTTSSGTYDNDTSNSLTLTVDTAPQLNWTTAPPANAFYNATFPIAAATNPTGGTVTYSVSGSCSLAGTTVTMTSGTGTCTVTANSAVFTRSSTTYGPMTITATVNAKLAPQATLNITGVPGIVSLGQQFTVGTTGGSGTGAVTFVASGICTNVGAQVTVNANTGACTVTATKAADTNYDVATASATGYGTAATILINANTLSQSFGSTGPVTATTSPAGLSYSVTYTGISPTNYPTSTTPPTGVGTYTVVAVITAPGYTGSDTNTETINALTPGLNLTLVSGKGSTVPYGYPVQFNLTVGSSNCPSGGQVQFLIDTLPVGSPVTLNGDCSVQSYATNALEPGTHTVIAQYSGDAGHSAGSSNSVSVTVQIDTTGVALAANPLGAINVGQSITFTATVTPSFVVDTGANIPTGSVQFYLDGNAIPDGLVTLSASSPYTAAYSTSSLTAGTHNIYATYVPGNSNEYQGSSSTITVQTVNLWAPIINWATPAPIVYGTALTAGPSGQLNATATDPRDPSGLTSVPGTFTYVPPAGTVLPVGPANLQVTFTPNDPATFATQTASVTLTVNAATLTVTADNQSRGYGAANPTLTYTISGFLNGDTIDVVSGAASCSTTANAGSSVGTYPINCTQGTLTANNYGFTFVSGNLNVTAVAPTLSLSCTEVTYDGNPHTCVGSAKGVDGITEITGTWSYSYSPSGATSAGSYQVTGTFTSSDSNYLGGTATGTLMIDKAGITLTAGSYFGIYDGASHNTVPSCVVGGTYTGTLSCNNSPSTVGPQVGTGTVAPIIVGDASNFTVTGTFNGTYDIAQATLTVTANNQTRAFGAANPTFTYTITGFKGSDTSAVISGEPSCSTTATPSSAVAGSPYPIVCSIGTLSATNYTFQFVSGNLTVTAAPVTATAGSYTGVYDASTHTPSACTITGTFTGTLVCTNSPATVGPTFSSGPIAPVISGDTQANYAITQVNGSWNITKAASTTTVTCPASVVYNGAAQTPCSANVTGVGTLNQSVTVTYTPNVNAGTVTASATFGGDSNHNSSTDTATFTITPAIATVTISNLAQFYTGSALPVTVTTSPSGLPLQVVYTGTSGTTYGPSTTAPTSTGNYTVVATVTNPNYAGQDTETLVIYPGSSGLNLLLHPGTSEPSLYGSTVEFDLLLGGTPCPTGTVQFFVDGTATGSLITLNPSTCSGPVPFLTATLEPGSHSVYAHYSGDTLYAGGDSNPVAHGVSANISNVSLFASQTPINVGQLETLFAQVIPNPKPDPGAKIPTGTVQFWDGNTLLGTSTLNGTYPYTAIFNTTALAAGTHNLIATFVSTDGTEYPGQSSTVQVQVQVDKIVPTITWPTPQPIVYGTAIGATQLNATAADTVSAPGISIALNGGTFVYTPASGTVLSAGSNALQVIFTPSASDAAKYTSATANVTLQVNQAVPTLTLSCPAATYNGNPHGCTGTATGVGGAAVAGTWSYNPGSQTAAGTFAETGTFTSTNGNYQSGGTATGSLKIDPAPVTVTAGSYSGVFDGSVHTIPGCSVAGSYIGGLSCTNSPSSVGAGVGSGTIAPTLAGDTLSNFAITTKDGSWSIAQATSTVAITCTPSVVYNGTARTPCSATVTGPGALSQSLTVTYTNNTNAGTASASASFAGDTNHTGSSNSATFTITAAPVTATAGSYSGVYDANTHATSPTCAVTGAYIGALSCVNTPASVGPGAGSGGVTPSVSGATANFSVTQVNGTWSIAKASSTTAISCPASVTYNGAAQTPCTATVTGAGGLSQSVAVTYTSNTNAGTATANANFGGDANHSSSSNSATFTIAPAAVTATAGSFTGVYNGAARTPSACVVTGSFTTGVSCTNSPASVGPAVGSGQITPTVSGGSSNFSVTSVNGAWSITRATSTVTVTCPASVTYNGGAQTPCTARVTGAGGLSQTLTPTYTNNTNAGTATASATFAGDTNHTGSTRTVNFTIAPAPVTATAGSFTGVFNGATRAPSACVVTGTFTTGVTCTNSPASVGPGVGSGNITPTVSGATSNFAVTPVNGTWSITAAASTVTVTCPASVSYNGAAQTPCSANVTGAGGLNQSVSVSYTSNTNAGTATASASFAGDANHAPGSNSATFSIAPAAVTATAGGYSGVYDGSSHAPAPTCAVTGPFTGGLTCTNGPASVGPAVGSGIVSPSVSGGSANFTVTSVNGAWSITPATSAVTINCPANVSYNGTARTPCTATVTGAGGLNQSVTVSYSNNTNAGTATATANFAGDPNHSASSNSATFTIAPAAVTATAGSYSGAFDGSSHAPSACAVTGAFTGTITCSNTPVSVGPAVGSGSITPTVSGGSANFTVTPVNGAWNITPAASAVTISCPASVTYTGTARTPCSATVTGTGGLSQSLTVTYTANTNAGTATANASFAGDANHAAASNSASFTIDPAPVTATAGSYSGIFDNSTHAPTACAITGAFTGTLSCTNSPTSVGPAVGSGAVTPTVTGGNANFAVTPVNGAWSITAAPSSVVVSCPASVSYNGAAQRPCTATVTGTGGLNQSLTVTYTGNTNAGTATASASFAGDANHAPASDSATFTIAPAAVTATGGSYSGAFDNSSHAPAACAIAGAFTGSLSCTNSPASVGPAVGSGSVTPTVTGGNANFAITPVNGSWSITPAAAVVAINCPASVGYNGTAQTPCTASVTGTGGLSQSLTVSYTSNTNAGTATASASFAGDANHAAASNSASFTIAKAVVTATAGSYTGLFDDATHAPSACAVTGPFTGGLTCTNGPSSVGPAVGSGSVTPTVTGGNANFNVTLVDGSWSITQATSTVTVNCPASVGYNGTAQTPCTATVTGTGGLSQSLTVTYTSNTNAGTATASASFGGDANHAASNDSASFTIAKAAVTATAGSYSGLFDNATHAPSACAVTGPFTGGLTCANGPTSVGPAVGSGTVTASVTGGNANFTVTLVDGSWSITPAASVVTVNCPASVGYNGAAQTPCTATVTGTGGLSQSLTVTYTNNTNAGTATASGSFAGDANHAAASNSSSFTIAKAAVTATAGSYSGLFDNASHAPSACAVTGAFTGGLTCTNSPASVGPAVGSGTVTPTVAGGNTNFVVTSVNGSWSITNANSLVTVSCPATVSYNGAAQTPCTATVTGTGGLNQSLTVSYTGNTNAGTATASASFAGDANHAAASNSASFAILPVAVTATAGSYSGAFDASSHATAPACAITGAFTGSLTCVNSPASVGPAVGSGTVTPTVTGGNANFTITAVNGSWSITESTATVAVSCPASVSYNGTAQTPCTATVTGSGGLNQSLSVTYSSNTNAGTATASASFAGDANHAAASNSASFTIAPAAVTATAGSYSGIFDASSHATAPTCSITGAYTTGLSCANNPASVGPGIGSGTVTPTVTGGNSNFAITQVDGSWSITKSIAEVTVNCPASMAYSGAALTPCTATVTGPGGLNQSLTVTYTSNTNPGTATANASFAGDGNHGAASNSAHFTITQGVATVTVSNLAQYYTGSPLPVTVSTVPSGLGVTVIYSSASYPSSSTAPTDPGSYTVTATVSDPNYVGQDVETLVIYPASSGLTLQLRSGMPEPSTYGTMAYFDLNLGGTPCPTGTVQFFVDTVASGSPVTLSGASCNTPITFQTARLEPGSHDVYASYSGDSLHASGKSNTVAHGVNADTTSVTLSTSATTRNVGQSFTFTATVNPTALDPSANGPAGTVEFFDGLSSLGIKTLSGSAPYTVTLTTSALGAGPHSISATYVSSGGEFTGSSSVVAVSVTVNKITPAINWATPASIVNPTPLSGTQLNATATDPVTSNPVAGTFAYTPASGTVLPVGTVNLEVTFTPTDTATYTTQTATVTLTVTAPAAKTLTVMADNQSRSYGVGNGALTYTITGFANGDTIAVVSGTASCSTSAAASSPVSGSPYAIDCTQGTLSASGYTFVFVGGKLTVTPAAPTLTLTCAAATYDGTAHACDGSATGIGGAVTGTWSYSPATETAAGSYPVTGTFTSSDGNYQSGTAAGTLKIDPAAVTATAGSYSGVFDNASHATTACALTGPYTTGLSCANSPASVGPAVGSGSVTPTVTGGNANFAITPVDGSWNITNATSTVAINCPVSVGYNGAAQTPCTATVTGTGGLSQSLTVTYTNNTNAGTATASASFAGDANHAASSDSANFTIAKAAVTATGGSYSGLFDNATHAPSDCSITGPYTTGLTCTNNPASVGPAPGSGSVAPIVAGGNANFAITTVNGSWTITNANSLVTVSCPATVSYNGAAQTPCTATVTGTGGLSQSLTVSYTNNTNAGTSTASASFAGDASHDPANNSASFTIAPAAVTATAGDYSGLFDNASHAPSACAVTGAFTGSLTCTNSPASVGPAVGSGTVTPTVVGGNANFVVTSVNGAWSITNATSSITMNCPASVSYNGAAQAPCTATVTGAGGLNQSMTVSYTSNTNAGTATASASFAGDANHAPSGKSATFTISPALVTATAGSYSAAFDGSSHAPSACELTGPYTTGLSCTNSPASVGPAVGSGTVTPTITGGNANFTITSVNGSWSITQGAANAVVAVNCPSSVSYDGTAHTPCTATVTGTGGLNQSLTVSYTNNTNAGTATASASFAGDANHAAASNSSSFTIAKAAVTATAGSYSALFDNASHAPSACAITGSYTTGLTCTNNPASVGPAAGSGSVAPIVAGGNANFAITTVNGSWTITNANSLVTVSCPATVSYNGAAQTPCTATVTGTGGLDQSLTVSYTSNTNAGTATANASFAGDASHDPANNSASFTIAPAAVTATAGSYSGLFDNAAHAPSACAVTGTYTGSLTCSNSPASVGPAAGSGTVTPTVVGGNANFVVTSVDGSWSITNATSLITMDCPASVSYNGAAQAPCTATVTGTGGLNQSLTVTYTSNTNAGTATASASFAGDANHAPGSKSATFTISPALVTATAGSYNAAFDGSSHAPSACDLTGSYTTGLTCTNSPASVGPAVGSGTVTPTVTGGNANFTITAVNGSWNITQGTESAVVAVNCPASVSYDGTAHTPCTATVTGTGGLNQSLTVSYTNNTNAGTATASASFAGDANHAPASNSASFAILPVAVTATAGSYSGLFDNTSHATSACAITGAYTIGLSCTNSPASVGPAAGSGSVTPTVTGGNANFAITPVNGSWNITNATATVSVSCPANVPFSGSALTPCTATATGIGGLDQVLTVTYVNNTNVGTATASASFAGDANHAAASNSATFTIGMASQVINFTQPASPVTYGVSSITLSATGGQSNKPVVFTLDASSTANAVLNGNTLTVMGVGNLYINADQAGDSNHLPAARVTRSIVVDPASLKVAANNATRVYGTSNPSFTGSVIGSANGEIFAETFSTTANISSNVGTYPIVPSATGANMSNYAVSIQNGTLTITQAGTTTSLTAGSSSVNPGQTVALNAQVVPATSGTPTGSVSFYDGTTLLGTVVLTNGAAQLSTSSLNAGTSNVLSAVYSGDTNFTTSSSSSTTIAVPGLDFSLAVAGSNNQTVLTGSTATYQVAVTPLYGKYPGQVSFAAIGMPAGGSITFNPSTISADSGKQTVTVTVQTPALAMQTPQSGGRKMPPLALALILLPLLGVGRMRKHGKRLSKLASIVLLLGSMLTGLAMTACGGGSGVFTQKQQTYTINVTATSGSVQRTASVTLVVK